MLRAGATEKKGKPVLCSLVLDEMAIREQVEWDGEGYCGYIHMMVMLFHTLGRRLCLLMIDENCLLNISCLQDLVQLRGETWFNSA